MNPEVANPPSKNGQNSPYSICIDWSSQPFFRALWSLNSTHQAKGTKLPLLYILPMCGTRFDFISLQVMKMQRIIKWVHNVSSEFWLATLGFIFSVISSSIFKISVRKYPDFCILNKFKCRYGHFNKKQQFFGDLLSYNIFSSFITWIKLPKDLQQYQNSRQINCILKISDIKFSMFIIFPSLQFG